ncbi:MAG: hypothetical protein Q4P34_04950 [Tissierellia bacterium]|nr:hypothetical protein [Tissierellia bacterium]
MGNRQKKKPFYKEKWFLVVIGLLFVFFIFKALGSGKDEDIVEIEAPKIENKEKKIEINEAEEESADIQEQEESLEYDISTEDTGEAEEVEIELPDKDTEVVDSSNPLDQIGYSVFDVKDDDGNIIGKRGALFIERGELIALSPKQINDFLLNSIMPEGFNYFTFIFTDKNNKEGVLVHSSDSATYGKINEEGAIVKSKINLIYKDGEYKILR